MTTLVIDGSFALHRAKNTLIRDVKKEYPLFSQNEEDIYYKDKIKQQSISNIFFSIILSKLTQFTSTRVYVLWDFGRCSYRTKINDQYKLKRVVQNPTFLQSLAENEYIKARSFLHTNLPKIGIASLLVPGVEADDIAYYLSHTLSEGVFVSDDKDWHLNLKQNWSLCRAMQENKQDKYDKNHIIDWNKFEHEMDVVGTNVSPRDVYLYEKAFMGDKDEIPKITGASAAKRLSRYIFELSDHIKEKDKLLLEQAQTQLKINLKLAETNWLVVDPTIVNMENVIRKAHACVQVGDFSFLEFAAEIGVLSASSRWSRVSKQLAY